MPQSFGSARPPSSRGSNAKSGTSEDRRQVSKEVSDLLTIEQTCIEIFHFRREKL